MTEAEAYPEPFGCGNYDDSHTYEQCLQQQMDAKALILKDRSEQDARAAETQRTTDASMPSDIAAFVARMKANPDKSFDEVWGTLGDPGWEDVVGGASGTWGSDPPEEAWLVGEPKTGSGTVRRSVLMEAEELVNGQRQVDYGSPRKSFQRIVSLWNSYLLNDPDQRFGLSPELLTDDVAMMLILLKVARYQGGGCQSHRDSLVDIAGYAACAEMLHEG